MTRGGLGLILGGSLRLIGIEGHIVQILPLAPGHRHGWRKRGYGRAGNGVLEDAPRLVRGMAVKAMTSRVPAQQHKHFVVVYQGESELKRITGFQRPGKAYILLLDPRGEIQWVSHGAVSDAALQELADRVLSLQRSE